MTPNLQFLEGSVPYLLAAFALGYLIGATPVGLLISSRLGLGDIRRIGSGNIGAMNVLRTGHKGAALLTLALDALKGYVPAAVGFWCAGYEVAAAAGLGAFVGHCFSFYLSFWGGKGVATGFGVFLALRWEVALICALIWLLVAAATRRASAASLSAVGGALIFFPLFEMWDVYASVLVMALIAVFRHRANIGRLWRGEEPKISLGRRA